jgi:hypothetical protein
MKATSKGNVSDCGRERGERFVESSKCLEREKRRGDVIQERVKAWSCAKVGEGGREVVQGMSVI